MAPSRWTGLNSRPQEPKGGGFQPQSTSVQDCNVRPFHLILLMSSGRPRQASTSEAFVTQHALLTRCHAIIWLNLYTFKMTNGSKSPRTRLQNHWAGPRSRRGRCSPCILFSQDSIGGRRGNSNNTRLFLGFVSGIAETQLSWTSLSRNSPKSAFVDKARAGPEMYF